ncbi:hypothetical protein AcV5_001500 [Taiwanofungus camphoratus]|nr:hypothetical protein AcV5_001500 [Antrodia cinnamomea]
MQPFVEYYMGDTNMKFMVSIPQPRPSLPRPPRESLSFIAIRLLDEWTNGREAVRTAADDLESFTFAFIWTILMRLNEKQKGALTKNNAAILEIRQLLEDEPERLRFKKRELRDWIQDNVKNAKLSPNNLPPLMLLMNHLLGVNSAHRAALRGLRWKGTRLDKLDADLVAGQYDAYAAVLSASLQNVCIEERIEDP